MKVEYSCRAVLRKVLSIALLAVVACFPAGGLAAENAKQAGYRAPAPEDFSRLSWSKAFDRLHEKFSREYAFTEWKKVDWDVLYKSFKPRIQRAQAAQDFTAYYLAVREYAHSIPDGHVRVTSLNEIDSKYVGGGFGFSATLLSDGRVIASWVDAAGAAHAQGLRAGDELTEWNGRPVREVLSAVSTVFGFNPATDEGRRNQQALYLTRAPVGTGITLAFSSNGEKVSAALAAYDDKGLSLAKSYPASVVSDGLRELILGADNPQALPESMVEKKLIGGDIGYIKVWGELDADLNNAGKAPSTLGLFRAALEEFNQAKVRGLIVDIRNNVGGLDSMVPDMLASFYAEKTLYEYQNCLNTVTGTMEIRPDDARKAKASDPGLYIEPGPPFFNGPVVAMINGKCVSSGEGLAMGFKNAPRGQTLGFYGTNGSFGLAGGEAKMPGGIEVHWPFGQSLDRNRRVQLDSRGGEGGVSPSIRVPMTRESAVRVARGEDVELEHAVEAIRSRISPF